MGFVQTSYTVSESAGSVEVCVQLTCPQIDILDEFVVVEVNDHPSSLYIPFNAALTSECFFFYFQNSVFLKYLTEYRAVRCLFSFFSSAPDTPNIFGQYIINFRTDYAQQTISSNAIDDETITELMRTVCYNQPIYDDALVEGSEWFGLTLNVDRSSVRTFVRSNYDQAAILILDNDGNAISYVTGPVISIHSSFIISQ